MHKELQILKVSTNIEMASLLHNRHRWYDLHFVHNETHIYSGHYVTLILHFSDFFLNPVYLNLPQDAGGYTEQSKMMGIRRSTLAHHNKFEIVTEVLM
jgi:hypothetical protein